MTAPPVVARNLRLVGGGGIIGIVYLKVRAWRLAFRACRWRKDAAGEYLTLGACGDACFMDNTVARRFQTAAVAAVRALTREVVAP